MNYARACVITGILNRNLNKEVSMSLDLTRTDSCIPTGASLRGIGKDTERRAGREFEQDDPR